MGGEGVVTVTRIGAGFLAGGRLAVARTRWRGLAFTLLVL